MEHDADRGREIGRKVFDDARENRYATGGGADYNQIAPAVACSLSEL